ncbi:Gas vesicle protein [Candidatus Desulfosporosinus infrequens]|uniref:Gas vesicle protein n=1 Tax=Candidatus Desulfosporosinus infrequens TaxID=2043169 RepID=A0A2U3LXC2_9FIRM|nr:Gas vesicle protein [Candidatus Desulfosporosinus infrequens]
MRNDNKIKKSDKVIKSAVFGGLVGTVMGLLLAPKSGKELRQDLAEQTHKMGNIAVDIKDKAQSAWLNIEDKTHVTVDTGKNWIQKGKRLVSNLKILVYEIRHGALTKTGSNTASDDKDREDLTEEI